MSVRPIARLVWMLPLLGSALAGAGSADEQPVPSYDDRDLARIRERHPRPDVEPGGGEHPVVRQSQHRIRAELDAEADAREATRIRWRRRASDARGAVRKAEAEVARAQAEADRGLVHLMTSCNGQPIGRRQRHARAVATLESAQRTLEQAHKALRDLEEEARRSSVPPGWIRE